MEKKRRPRTRYSEVIPRWKVLSVSSTCAWEAHDKSPWLPEEMEEAEPQWG